jgi:hypothetical protein
MRACYEKLVETDAKAKGWITTKFVIGLDGHVESADFMVGTLVDPATTACVVGVYQTLQFPKPKGGKVLVRSPVEFATATSRGKPVPACRDWWVLRDVVASQAPKFAQCAKELKQRDPEARGVVGVQFTMRVNGTVSDARPTVANIDDRDAIDCVSAVFWRLTFPECDEDVWKVWHAEMPVVLPPAKSCTPAGTCLEVDSADDLSL